MPNFRVTVRRYVEEVATVEVTAHSYQEAVALAEERSREEADTLIWEDGDDIVDGDVAPTGDGIATFVDIEETGDAWQRVGDEWESAT